MTTRPGRGCFLSTAELFTLDTACRPICDTFDSPPYLVGSARERPDFRDVDVRSILPDEEWDTLFAGRDLFWSLFCYAVSQYLHGATGLPVDYQVQRRTEANEKFGGQPRNPLGLGHPGRIFAGGGDFR